jgi:hypothetical protein
MKTIKTILKRIRTLDWPFYDPDAATDTAMQFSKDLLCATDAQIKEIREHSETERANTAAAYKEERERQEYETYLKLKAKFENGGKHYTVRK